MLLNINGNYYLCNCFEVWRGLITYLVQKGACMSFPCFTVGLSRFTVWMKVKRGGRKGSILGGVFRHFVQKNHHFENQPIKQNDGLTI